MGNRKIPTKIKRKTLKMLAENISKNEIKKKTGVSERTLWNWQKDNCQSIADLKQAISEKYLKIASLVPKYITEKKLQDTSAHSLVTMGRESAYTSQMLMGELTPEINITIPTQIDELKSFVLKISNEKTKNEE